MIAASLLLLLLLLLVQEIKTGRIDVLVSSVFLVGAGHGSGRTRRDLVMLLVRTLERGEILLGQVKRRDHLTRRYLIRKLVQSTSAAAAATATAAGI